MAKKRTYPSRTRLANKTQWALDDMLKLTRQSRERVAELLAWMRGERLDAKGHFDAQRLDHLVELGRIVSELTLEIAELERLASDARIGEYQQPTKNHPGAAPGMAPAAPGQPTQTTTQGDHIR